MNTIQRNTNEQKVVPIWKVFLHLRGIAILAVIINHAAFFGVTEYRFLNSQVTSFAAPFNIPFNMITPGWIIIQELTRFSVPLFLVLAGHYIACFCKSFKSIIKQAEKFIIPFIVWSFIGWLYSFAFSPPGWTVKSFLFRVLHGESQPGYYFLVLIIQYYVLSSLLKKWVQKKPGLTLFVAALSTLACIAINYMIMAGRAEIIHLNTNLSLLEESIFPRFMFFFVLGIWIGYYPDRLKKILQKRAVTLYIVTIISAVLVIIEHGLIFHLIMKQSPEVELWKVFKAMAQWKISTNVSSVFIILTLIRLGQRNLLSFSFLKRIGTYAYEIFILNGPCLVPLAYLLGLFSIETGYEWISFIILSIITILIPLSLMRIAARYFPKARILFGYK